MNGRADLEDTHVGSDGPGGSAPALDVREFAALPEELMAPGEGAR